MHSASACARPSPEGCRVLDVCVLTFLIRGINERRVSDTRVCPYEFATVATGRYDRGASPIRGHTKRNWTPYTTRCVRGSASSPARPAGRRRQWRSGRACGSGVRSHVTRTRRHTVLTCTATHTSPSPLPVEKLLLTHRVLMTLFVRRPSVAPPRDPVLTQILL